MTPTDITVHTKSRTLDISFEDGSAFSLPFEYLRVYSPSAEVRGHGAGEEVLQVGKRAVGITGVAPVGNYAIQPVFTDGHDSGLYTWDYLYQLGRDHARLWQAYLDRLHAAGFAGDSGREPGTVLPGAAARSHGCGHQH